MTAAIAYGEEIPHCLSNANLQQGIPATVTA